VVTLSVGPLVRGSVVLLGVLLGAPTWALPADVPPLLTYREERLSVRLERVPLADVMAMLASESGAEVDGELDGAREVTNRFDAVPIAQALDRLLGDQNFTLTYGEDGRLLRVRLHGLAAPRRPVRPPAATYRPPRRAGLVPPARATFVPPVRGAR
jgi:hypothetical protein